MGGLWARADCRPLSRQRRALLEWRGVMPVCPDATVAADAMAGDLDPSGLLDVDGDKLVRRLAFVAMRGLEPQAPEFAHPDPGQDPGRRRESRLKHISDLPAGEPQTPQREERSNKPDSRRSPVLSTRYVAERTLTSAAAAASLNVRFPRTAGRQGSRRPSDRPARQLLASMEARMDQPAQELRLDVDKLVLERIADELGP